MLAKFYFGAIKYPLNSTFYSTNEEIDAKKFKWCIQGIWLIGAMLGSEGAYASYNQFKI